MATNLALEQVKTLIYEKCFDYAKSANGCAQLRALFEKYGSFEGAMQTFCGYRDQSGDTVLMVACSHLRLDTAKYLLKIGASVSERNVNSGFTPLHYVCARKQVPSNKADIQILNLLLLNAGADPIARDFLYRTPFQLLQLRHISKANPRLLRYYENIVSQFAGFLSLESFTTVQRLVGKAMKTQTIRNVSKRFGTDWKKRWCVILRLQGSKAFIQRPLPRCTKCFHLQTLKNELCSNCNEQLPPRSAPKRSRVQLLMVYPSPDSTKPLLVADLSRSRVEFIERTKMIKLSLCPQFQTMPDPMVVSSPELWREFGAVRASYSTRGKDVLLFRSSTTVNITTAYAALTQSLRQVPEPNVTLHRSESRAIDATLSRSISTSSSTVDKNEVPFAIVVPDTHASSMRAAEPVHTAISAVLPRSESLPVHTTHGAGIQQHPHVNNRPLSQGHVNAREQALELHNAPRVVSSRRSNEARDVQNTSSGMSKDPVHPPPHQRTSQRTAVHHHAKQERFDGNATQAVQKNSSKDVQKNSSEVERSERSYTSKRANINKATDTTQPKLPPRAKPKQKTAGKQSVVLNGKKASSASGVKGGVKEEPILRSEDLPNVPTGDVAPVQVEEFGPKSDEDTTTQPIAL